MNVLVGIKSCWKYQGRRHVCRETWIPDCAWPYRFFVGSHKPLKPFGSMLSNMTGEPDLEICSTLDDFKNIAPKIQGMCQWAVHEDASHLIVADDDTYWRPERVQHAFQKWIELRADVVAFMRTEPIYPQGSFYVLSKKAFTVLAGSDVLDDRGPDDVLVGKALTPVKDIIWYHCKDIHVGPHWKEQQPRPYNSILSTHKCLAGDMLEAHQLWKDSYGIR